MIHNGRSIRWSILAYSSKHSHNTTNTKALTFSSPLRYISLQHKIGGFWTISHLSSLKQNYGPKKRRKETASGKKGNDENAAGAVLFVSFWPGSSMPSRSNLVSVYSKFGALNEAETNMFRTNYTARVSFLRTSDAQKAYNHSQNNNPFGSPVDVTFQLLHSSDVCCCSYSVECGYLPIWSFKFIPLSYRFSISPVLVFVIIGRRTWLVKLLEKNLCRRKILQIQFSSRSQSHPGWRASS